MMFKRILLASILAMVSVTGIAFGVDGDKTITSKNYVDTLVGTKQAKIPAAGQLGVDAGSTVVTYTSTSGTTGERQLYTDSTSYTAGTDADKLITASALNGAFTNLPTTDTTKLTCANSSAGCTLWNISIQTAYGNAAGGGSEEFSLLSLAGTTGTSYCSKRQDTGRLVNNGCSTTFTSSFVKGDFGVVFDVNGETLELKGISTCSNASQSSNAYSYADDQAAVQTSYENRAIVNNPYNNPYMGRDCYCKLLTPTVSRWVFRSRTSGGTTEEQIDGCLSACSNNCARTVQGYEPMQNVIFVPAE